MISAIVFASNIIYTHFLDDFLDSGTTFCSFSSSVTSESSSSTCSSTSSSLSPSSSSDPELDSESESDSRRKTKPVFVVFFSS
jgi:hypothetical protein